MTKFDLLHPPGPEIPSCEGPKYGRVSAMSYVYMYRLGRLVALVYIRQALRHQGSGRGRAKGRSPVRGNSDPMREAGATSTDWSSSRIFSRGGSVLAPPGVVMLALPTVPRNASREQSEGRVA